MNEQTSVQSDNLSREDVTSRIARILALDIVNFPEFKRNPYFAWQRDASRYTLHALQEALKRGYLNLSDFQRVFDFGAGGGGPTFILDQICKIIGGNVEALETNPEQSDNLRRVVPSVPVHIEDGLHFLDSLNGEASMVTAFTFGPDKNGKQFLKLAESSNKALTTNGKLFLYSDDYTFSAVQRKIITLNISGNEMVVIPQINQGDTYKFSPATLIFSRHGCSLVK